MPLFIVSTPIGNLKDITINALEILSSSHVILSEDTRTTFSLLKHHGIEGKKIIPFTDHTEEKTFLPFLEMAKLQNISLVSDAGTPLICDPGFLLVKKAREMQIEIRPIPGASSLIAAISASGIAFHKFTFLGFFDKNLLTEAKIILQQGIGIAFFLPARDILKTLQLAETNFIEYDFCVARELTKFFEDIKSGGIPELIEHYSKPEKLKGEAVILISAVKKNSKTQDLKVILEKILKEKPFLTQLKSGEIAEILKTYETDLAEVSKKEIYNNLLKIK